MDREIKQKSPLLNLHPWQGFHILQAASYGEKKKLFHTSRTTYRSDKSSSYRSLTNRSKILDKKSYKTREIRKDSSRTGI
ncbi:hypothetical protein [Methanosarcina sp.]|uniref:hypothetical protein n=1 Tax=Methanosarcina sp. TaxID=2213 RepID=UPI002ABCE853|nr:hypothetical protein [Methanosarcina sp.]MDY9926137.1 hypothetical protein [Methanosarcina sp.]